MRGFTCLWVVALAAACESGGGGSLDAALPTADASPSDDAGLPPHDAGAADAVVEPGDGALERDASDAGSLEPDAGPLEPDADASAEPWVAPVDLDAPWSRTGTAVPERAALLAGCTVTPTLAGADATAPLRAALSEAAARAGGGRCAVVLGAGTWRVTETLELSSGVVLMGAGSARTRLDFAVGAREIPLVRARGAGRPELELSGDDQGGALGSAEWSVSATVAAQVAAIVARTGRAYVEVAQENDPAKFPARWAQAYAARGVGQLARVVAVGAASLTLDRPLSEHYLPGSGFTKHLTVLGPGQVVERAGLMDLALRRGEDAHDSSVFFDRTVGAFVVRVESLDTGWSHVAVDRSLACVVRESWLHGAHGHGDGGRGYGVNLRSHTTGCRVEDNALDDLRHALIVQLGANQNVYGYNFSTDSHDELGITKADIAVHGHYAHLNLFEGNDVELAHVADWHGPTPRQVLFRNRARVLGIYVDDASERTALIDNVSESAVGFVAPLRAHSSVRRLICQGNRGPDGAPLAISGRSDCDDENARDVPVRPRSLYRDAPLVDPATGEVAARVRWEAGRAVPQP